LILDQSIEYKIPELKTSRPFCIMKNVIRLPVILGCIFGVVARAADPGDSLVFTGMCDASAAVAVDSELFVAATDEDNILRFYRWSRPGAPVFTFNLNPHLAGRKKSPESDIEGAARLGQRVFWITSHGPNAAGELLPSRCRLFALDTTNHGADIVVQPAGRVYSDLIVDLARAPVLSKFGFSDRRNINIEALSDTADGKLLIGFRSPIPEGRALLVPLLNPNELLAGQPPKFGEPVLLDLGGLGLRGMGSTRNGYYLVAGPAEEKRESRLFFWKGGDAAAQPVDGVSLRGITPESTSFEDVGGRSDFLVLSDDSNRKLNGKDCKESPEAQRQFRAIRIPR
jgi:hypothetical protein